MLAKAMIECQVGPHSDANLAHALMTHSVVMRGRSEKGILAQMMIVAEVFKELEVGVVTDSELAEEVGRATLEDGVADMLVELRSRKKSRSGGGGEEASCCP